MNPPYIVLACLFSAIAGFLASQLVKTSELAECQRHWHACDLTAEGSSRLVGDLSERIDVCELGLEAADATIGKINDAATFCDMNLTICQARIVVRDRKAPRP